jgi:chaperonin cofactor prefoldin
MAESKETVIIEFIVENKEVQPSIDLLEKVGMVDKKVADQFKKSNTDYQARVKATKDLSDQNKTTGKSIEDLAKQAAKVPDAIGGANVKQAFDDVKKGAEEAKAPIEDALEGVETKGKTAKARLKELKTELNNLADAGKEDSEQFKKISNEAGQLLSLIHI